MTLDYSFHKSLSGRRDLTIDRKNNTLCIEINDGVTGDFVIGEFDLAEAEEIAASISRVCKNIRTNAIKAGAPIR